MTIEEKLEDLLKPIGLKNLIIENMTIVEYFKITPGKERNLLINLTNYVIKKDIKDLSKMLFTENELRENIFFKDFDNRLYTDIFFEKINLEYKINSEILEKIENYIRLHLKYKDIALEEQFKNLYLELSSMIFSGKMDYNNYNALINKSKEIAKELHWKYLPIYDETIMENREKTPEEDLDVYYDHYHTIEDLYENIYNKKVDLKSKNGDISLEKEMNFKVYTARWNGYDNYRVKRTWYGWHVSHIAINGPSIKDGNGALFTNLKHDSIFYPENGVKFSLDILWEDADNGEINFEELQNRLQEVADWISDVEKNLRRKQPEWCNYY